MSNANLIFRMSSLSLAISIPVHDDTANLYIPVTTPNKFPAVNFSGSFVASGREFVWDSLPTAVTGGPFCRLFWLTRVFAKTKLTTKSNQSNTIHTFSAFTAHNSIQNDTI